MRLSIALLVIAFPILGCQGQIDNPAGNGGGSGSSAPPGGACSQPGQTQVCCITGVQTCAGSEISSWSDCVDPNGNVLTCCVGEFGCGGDPPPLPPNVCMPGEFDHCLPALCEPGDINNEAEILVGYLQAGGQIKVWVNDEHAEIIAPHEQVDLTTGMIITPGDRMAKAPDGYLWEPALYIAPETAENAGTPHFPVAFKGSINNTLVKGPGTKIPGMDPPPAGTTLHEQYTTEVIWDVSTLGLGAGNYIGEFVIHDGDTDRGIGCLSIVIP